ncbi:MAG: hypothetical protein QQN55_08345 [Nitrosopumilus sp.]
MKTIKIKNEDKSYIRELMNKEDEADIMMEHGAQLSRKAHKELWKFLCKKYKLNNVKKPTRYSLNSDTMEIKEITQ